MHNSEGEAATNLAKRRLAVTLKTLDVLQIQQAISDAQAVFSEGPELVQAQADLRGIKAMKKLDLAFKKGDTSRFKPGIIDCAKVIGQCEVSLQCIIAFKMNQAVRLMVEKGDDIPDLDAKVVSIMATSPTPIGMVEGPLVEPAVRAAVVEPKVAESAAVEKSALAAAEAPRIGSMRSVAEPMAVERMASLKRVDVSVERSASRKVVGSPERLASLKKLDASPDRAASSKRLELVAADAVGAAERRSSRRDMLAVPES